MQVARLLRNLVLALGACALLIGSLGLTACGSKEETETKSGEYYEGPMAPKSERVGAPGQQAGGQ